MVTREMDAAEVRRRRIDRLEGRASATEEIVGRESTSNRREKMVDDEEQTSVRTSGRTSGERDERRSRRRENRETKEERHRRKKREAGRETEGSGEYVYGPPREREKKESATVRVAETRTLGRDGESSSDEEEEVVERISRRESVKERPREKKIKVVYVKKEEHAPRHKERVVKVVRADRPRESESEVRRSKGHTSRRASVVEVPLPPSPPRRYVSLNRMLYSELTVV